MTELLKELEAMVCRIAGDAAEVRRTGGDPERERHTHRSAVNFIRTHHAEIAGAVKDAERWRALHWGEAPMVTVTGSQLARGIRPGDFAVPWDWPVTSRTRIRMIVMNNSAREVGE